MCVCKGLASVCGPLDVGDPIFIDVPRNSDHPSEHLPPRDDQSALHLNCGGPGAGSIQGTWSDRALEQLDPTAEGHFSVAQDLFELEKGSPS